MSDSRKDAKHKAAMKKQKANIDASIDAASTERGVAILLTGDGYEQVFRAHEFILEPVSLVRGSLERAGDTRCNIYLISLTGCLRAVLQGLFHSFPDTVDVNVEFSQNISDNAVILLEQGEQHVLHVPLAMVILKS